MSSTTVDWHAHWIHNGVTADNSVHYGWFLKDFTVAKPVRKALLHITADRRYRLHVDRQYVGQGPIPCNGDYWSYDTIDITRRLTKGRHSLLVLVQQGETCLGKRPVALLCQLEMVYRDGSRGEITSDTTWRTVADHGWESRPPRVFGNHHDYVEMFDSRRSPVAPDLGNLGRVSWQPARLFSKWVFASEETIPIKHIGQLWKRLMPRDIPFMEERVIAPTAPVAFGEVDRGYSDKGPGTTGELWRGLENLLPVTHVTINDTGHINRGNGKHAILKPHIDRAWPFRPYFPAIILDLGEVRNGTLMLDVEGKAGSVIDITYAQNLQDGKAYPRGGSTYHVKRYVMRDGRQRWESFEYCNCRYVQITVTVAAPHCFTWGDDPAPVKIYGVGMREIRYPVRSQAAFSCSDPELTELYNASVHAIRVCTNEKLNDNTIREKLNWAGDITLLTLPLLSVFGNLAVVERYFRLFFREQHPSGYLPSIAPDTGFQLFDHGMSIPVRLQQCHQLTGDSSLPIELYPGVKRYFDFLHSLADSDGLLREVPYPVWFDWAPLNRTGTMSTLQFYYARSLIAAIELARLAGRTNDAEVYAGRLNAIRRQSKLFWSERKGMFVECVDEHGRQSATACEHANALAILCDIGSKRMRDRIMDTVFGRGLGFDRNRGVIKSAPSFQPWVLEALSKAGRPDLVMEFLHSRNMLWIRGGLGTIPEVWDFDARTLDSAVQATSPESHVLLADCLGVKPVEPGYRTFSVSPFPGRLEWIQGTKPTPHGEIAVRVEQRGDEMTVRVTKPSGTTGRIAPPAHYRPKAVGAKGCTVRNGVVFWEQAGAGTRVFVFGKS